MSNNLTKKQIAEYKAVFKLFDKNNNGYITAIEFKDLLKKYNIYMNDEEIDKEIVKYDKNGDLKIDFEEFINIITNMDKSNS